MCEERKEAYGGMKSVTKLKNWNGNKTKAMHAKVKEMSTKKRSKSGTNCIGDKNGKMLFDSNDVINKWVEHVTELYYDERGVIPIYGSACITKTKTKVTHRMSVTRTAVLL